LGVPSHAEPPPEQRERHRVERPTDFDVAIGVDRALATRETRCPHRPAGSEAGARLDGVAGWRHELPARTAFRALGLAFQLACTGPNVVALFQKLFRHFA
jgi:hypothetical protein